MLLPGFMGAPTEVAFGRLLLLGIGLMVLAAGALLSFVITYQRRLLQEQLRLHTIEAAHRQQLLDAIIETQEAERERIGRDLHDNIGSTLAALKLLVNRLDKQQPTPDKTHMLALIKDIVGSTTQEVRGISHSLYPAVLTHFGLAEAIEYLVAVYREAGTLAITLDVEYRQRLPLAQELALYRICQELIGNALKHAQGATKLTITLQQKENSLQLAVEDNGCGFALPSPDQPTSVSSGIGLRSINVRVQMLQAHLHQHSSQGQGTRMMVEVNTPVLI